MKLISRYVLTEFFRILAMTLMGLVLVFLIVDFLDRIDNFMEVHMSLGRVGYYYLMSIPAVVFQLAPVAVLIAILISLGLLARHSEIVAMKASGVSLYRVSMPLFAASIMISLLVFGLSDTVLPNTSSEVNTIWNVEVEQQRDSASPLRKDVWFRSEDGIINFKIYNQETKRARGVSLSRLTRNFRLVERIEALSGDLQDGVWVFHNGLVKTYPPNGKVFVRHFEAERIPLPDLPEEFAQVQRAADEMSFADLSNWIRRMENEGYDPLRYRVDLQLKLAFPFLCAIMALIGLPLALWKEKGGGTALGIGVGIGLSFVYIVFLGLSRSLGYSGLLAPVLAAWMPNMIFTLLGLFLFTHVKQ